MLSLYGIPLLRWLDDVALEKVIQKLLDFDGYLDRWQRAVGSEDRCGLFCPCDSAA